MAAERELLLLYADGEASPEEAARVKAVLRESPELRGEYARLVRRRLMLAEILAAEAAPVVLLPAGESISEEAVGRPARSRLRHRVQIVAALAAAVLLAVGGWWLLRGDGEHPAPAAPAGYVVSKGAPLAYGQPLIVLGGDAVEVKLADASVLRVGSESRVTVTAARRVNLASGQTRVQCKSDGDNPFVVTAAGTTVRALGTEFLVMVDNEAGDGRGASRSPHEKEKKMFKKVVSVVVLSGAVMVANGFGEIRLAAGEAGVSKGGERPSRGGGAKDKDKGGKKGTAGLGDEELKGLGTFVQEKLAEGLRGKELADAIHKRLEERKRARHGGKGKCAHGEGGECTGEGKKHKHKHKKGKGDGDGEGKGKKHQHKHKKGEGDGDGEGKGKKHQHKHGEGEGGGEGKGHGKGGDGEGKGHGKGGGGEGKGHGKGGGDAEPGAGGEGEGKGKGRGGGGGGDRGGRGGGGRGGR